jgi:hypothetical protein
VVDEQLYKIRESGLYDKTDKIYINVLGEEKFELSDTKIEITRYKNLNTFEYHSINKVKQLGDNNDCKLWYIHTKGVSFVDSDELKPFVSAWRKYMEYFIVDKYENCINELNNNDICGVEWKQGSTIEKYNHPHFSGNFWWSNSDYIKKLEIPKIKQDRFYYEFWIGSCLEEYTYKCFHSYYEHGVVSLYEFLINPEDYEKKSLDKNIEIYTSITNGYDIERNDIKSIKVVPTFKNPIKDVRKCKILSHEYIDADISIWVDGNIYPLIDDKELVDKYLGDSDMALFKHPYRDCIYDEFGIVSKLKYDLPEILDNQMTKYKISGYPEKNGLCETGFLIRRNNEKVNNFNETWWNEVLLNSHRDQLSFNYVLDKFPDLKVNYIEGNIRNHSDFKYVNHPKHYSFDKKYEPLHIYPKVLPKNPKKDIILNNIITNSKKKIVVELPKYSYTSGGVLESIKLANKMNTLIRFQKLKDYPILSNKWTVGLPDHTFPECDVCITYSDNPHISDLLKLSQVKKVLVYMLSYGMSIERERKNALNKEIIVMCSTKKIEKEILKDGGIVHRVGF